MRTIFSPVNPVNINIVVAYAIGFNLSDIGYLYFLANRLWRIRST